MRYHRRPGTGQPLGEVGRALGGADHSDERATGHWRRRSDVPLAMKIAGEVQINGEPAIRDSAVRAKIANFHVLEAG